MKNRPHLTRQNGSTLIEVMVAIIVLAVLVLGSAYGIFHANSIISSQRDKRTALELATGQLEIIRSTSYSDLETLAPDFGLYYLNQEVTASYTTNPNERIDINNPDNLSTREFPITIQVQRQAPSSGPVREFFELTVTLGFSNTRSEQIELKSIYAP